MALPSSISAIGSVVMLANGSTSNLVPGSTVAGSSLLYQSTITAFAPTEIVANAIYYSEGSGTTPFNQNKTYFEYGVFGATRNGAGNPGFALGGTTAMSGTWRVLTPASARAYRYEFDYNTYGSIAKLFLAIRIA
jgi:hypothetical protein